MNRFIHRAFVFVQILAFLTVSTAALAHGHPDTNSASESHCVMCMAAHGATHLIAVSAIALHFAQVQSALLTSIDRVSIPFIQQFSIQDRAPPLF
jgi:uncharacterized membrane protein